MNNNIGTYLNLLLNSVTDETDPISPFYKTKLSVKKKEIITNHDIYKEFNEFVSRNEVKELKDVREVKNLNNLNRVKEFEKSKGAEEWKTLEEPEKFKTFKNFNKFQEFGGVEEPEEFSNSPKFNKFQELEGVEEPEEFPKSPKFNKFQELEGFEEPGEYKKYANIYKFQESNRKEEPEEIKKSSEFNKFQELKEVKDPRIFKKHKKCNKFQRLESIKESGKCDGSINLQTQEELEELKEQKGFNEFNKIKPLEERKGVQKDPEVWCNSKIKNKNQELTSELMPKWNKNHFMNRQISPEQYINEDFKQSERGNDLEDDLEHIPNKKCRQNFEDNPLKTRGEQEALINNEQDPRMKKLWFINRIIEALSEFFVFPFSVICSIKTTNTKFKIIRQLCNSSTDIILLLVGSSYSLKIYIRKAIKKKINFSRKDLKNLENCRLLMIKERDILTDNVLAKKVKELNELGRLKSIVVDKINIVGKPPYLLNILIIDIKFLNEFLNHKHFLLFTNYPPSDKIIDDINTGFVDPLDLKQLNFLENEQEFKNPIDNKEDY